MTSFSTEHGWGIIVPHMTIRLLRYVTPRYVEFIYTTCTEGLYSVVSYLPEV